MEEYDEGDKAFWAGASINDNPYTEGSARYYMSWQHGWLFAQWMSTQGGTQE